MKRLLICTFILIFSFGLNGQWWWLKSEGAYADVYKIQAVTDDIVWALATHGVLLKSTDRGLTWKTQLPDLPLSFISMFFISAQRGFITGYNGYLYKTTNGGDTWTTHQVYPGLDLYTIHFVNASIGFIACNTGGILKTSDGGESWSYITAVAGVYRSLAFYDEQVGLITHDYGKISRTTDGGVTWLTASTVAAGSYDYVRDLQWVSPNKAFAVTYFRKMFETSDTGRTWQPRTIASSFNPYTIHFTDSLYGVVLDESMKLAKTTDGGATFNELPRIYNDYGADEIYMYNRSHIYIAGPDQFTHMSSDGGGTWITSNSQTDIKFNTQAAYSTDEGLVVGDKGLIARYGHFFSGVYRNNSATRLNLYAAAIKGDTKAIIAGEQGIILVSTADNYSTWATYNTGLINDLYSLAAYGNINTVFAVGEGGIILRSTNFGVNWEQMNSGVTVRLNEIRYFDQNNLLAVGDSGIAVRSTDAGLTWFLMPVNTTLNLNSVTGAASNRLISGDKGLVLRSSNKGDSWHRVIITDTSDIPGVASATQNSARLVTKSGVLYNTTNAGQSWSRELIINNVTFTGIATYRSTDMTFLCNQIQILSYVALVPVELTSFSANVTGSSVTLNWTTASETNNQGFEIQHSSDQEEWVSIGFKQGMGTTTEKSIYSITFEIPMIGTNYYRLKQTDFDGQFEYSQAVSAEYLVNPEFSLEQNYPNPFNPVTEITYSFPSSGKVQLKIYNTTGEEVAVLVNELQEAGKYTISFNGSGLASGAYLYRITVNSDAGIFNQTRKMLLLK